MIIILNSGKIPWCLIFLNKTANRKPEQQENGTLIIVKVLGNMIVRITQHSTCPAVRIQQISTEVKYINKNQ